MELQEVAGLVDVSGTTITSRFVGFATTSQRLLISLPKVAPESTVEAANNLHSLLTVFARRQAKLSLPIPEPFGRGSGVELECLRTLIDWTESFGWAQAWKTEPTFDPRDPIEWGPTIKRSLALHLRTGVIYHAPVRSRIQSETSKLASLQARALHELWRFLSPLSAAWLPKHHWALEESEALRLPVAQLNRLRCLDLLEEIRESSNRDHDLDLIALLESYYRRTGTLSQLGLLGTKYFHVVWEDMCRHIFETSRTLLQHANVASQPWLSHGSSVARAGGVQKPDVLYWLGEGYAVFDAKYYCWPETFPGVPDAVKQAMYELTLPRVSSNAYIVPVSTSDYDSVVKLGELEFLKGYKELVPDLRLPKVIVIGLPWKTAVSAYLGRVQSKSICRQIEHLARSNR